MYPELYPESGIWIQILDLKRSAATCVVIFVRIIFLKFVFTDFGGGGVSKFPDEKRIEIFADFWSFQGLEKNQLFLKAKLGRKNSF